MSATRTCPCCEQPLDSPDLGPCCICERAAPEVFVRTIFMLDVKGPIPGHGWGCLQCGLPSDGATAVVCDDCLGPGDCGLGGAKARLRFVCRGWPATDGRLPIEALGVEPHEHDRRRHPEIT